MDEFPLREQKIAVLAITQFKHGLELESQTSHQRHPDNHKIFQNKRLLGIFPFNTFVKFLILTK